jgi:hypothetical protein
MKPYGKLSVKTASFAASLSAKRTYQRGKRWREVSVRFLYDLARNLFILHKALQLMMYQPRPYDAFWGLARKKRLTLAGPYRDRVVRGALCRVVEGILDGTFAFDRYANRVKIVQAGNHQGHRSPFLTAASGVGSGIPAKQGGSSRRVGLAGQSGGTFETSRQQGIAVEGALGHPCRRRVPVTTGN